MVRVRVRVRIRVWLGLWVGLGLGLTKNDSRSFFLTIVVQFFLIVVLCLHTS